MIKSFLKKYKKIWAILFGSLFFLTFVFTATIYLGFWGKIPSKKALSTNQLDKATLITDASDRSLGALYLEERFPVSFEELPPHLIDALIATEDERFYAHEGVDLRSLFRVFFKTILLQDASSGGGSTLTQQLAKNLYPRKGSGKLALVAAKVRESIIAARLEGIYTKEELIEKYLNTVSFSDNTFGIESASLHFFNKSSGKLTIEESATLVGMLKATHTYNPRLFPNKSKERRNTVMHQMRKNGKLDPAVCDSLSKSDLVLNLSKFRLRNTTALYFKEQVRKELLRWAKDYEKETGQKIDIYRDGLLVKTTLDLGLQVQAEKAMNQHLTKLQQTFEGYYSGKNPPWKNKTLIRETLTKSAAYQRLKAKGYSTTAIWDSLNRKTKKQVFSWTGKEKQNLSITDSITHYLKLINTGWVSLQPSTGAVKTWIGGVDYRYLQFDHVIQSKRQVGSVFKPIVYATAIEEGIEPCKYYDLRRVEYENLDGWTPDNASKKEERPYLNYNMEHALSHSVNTVAVKVLEDTGIETVIETARKMGITSELPAVASLALGTAEISVLEMATAYTAFLNQGKSSNPYLIEQIVDASGKVLYDHVQEEASQQKQALSPETARLVLEMMRTTIDEGTAKRIRSQYNIHSDLAGKTGTTQNNKDGWFVGLSKDLVSVSWVGMDDQRLGFPNTRIGQGANSALPMFALWWKSLQNDNRYKTMANSTFDPASQEIMQALDCEPVKEDGFFKRLFKNPNKTKKRNFKGLTTQSD